MPAASVRAGDLDLPAASFTLRSNDGSSVIGSAHFTITRGRDDLSVVRGEYRFLDGHYDIDESTVRPGVGNDLPTLVETDHSFFLADGSRDRDSHIDFATGVGTCTVWANGVPEISSAKMDFPADTFVGLTVVIPLRRFVAAGAEGSLKFHVFNCVPGPKLLTVSATAKARAPWPYYPGSLVEIDIKPDLGWIGVVIAPFLPEMRAWFDPGADWDIVGARAARYYKGLKYLMVRSGLGNAELKAARAAERNP